MLGSNDIISLKMPRPEQIKPYDPRFYEDLIADGYDPSAARRIACTEMDGANTNPDGTINSRQTCCDTLMYRENLEESPDALQASQEAQNAAEMAAISQGFSSLKEYYEALGLSTEDL